MAIVRETGGRSGLGVRGWSAVAGVLAGTALLAPATPAEAFKSTYRAQPGYPASTLAMKVRGKPRQRGLVRLNVTGSNRPFPIGFDPDFPGRQPLNYTLDVYIQERSAYSNCAPSKTEQNDRIINLPDKVKQVGSLIDIGQQGAFRRTIVFRAGSARKIMFCAYTRYSAVDDIVMGSLKHNLAKKKRRRR